MAYVGRILFRGQLVLVGVAVALNACSTTSPPPLTAEAAASRPSGEYRLGLGDKLRVNVYGERDLSGEYQVAGKGVVTMPLIGDVPALGLTARELEAALVSRYRAGILLKPSVTVEVFGFRPFFVLGEVERPGSYPTLEGTTLLGAVATAGGYTYRANTKRVFIRRAGDSLEYQVDTSQPFTVAPGDVIRVGERHF